MRVIGRVLGGMAVAASAVVLGGHPVGAVGPDRTAWWSATEVGVPIPAPAVPAGGFQVQQGPSEPLAYAAVHYPAESGAVGTLLLDVAGGSTALQSKIQACPPTQAWKATDGPGLWSQRPAYGSGCSIGVVATDGSAVAFPVTAGRAGGVDLVLVGVDGSTPFSVTFAKPSAESLKVAPLPVATGAATPAPASPAATPDQPSVAVPGPSSSPSGFTPPAPSSFDSAGLAAPASPAAPATPSSSPPVTAGSPTGVALPVRSRARPASFSDERGQRLAAVLGLLGLVAAWGLVGGQPLRRPRLIGALAEGTPAEEGPHRRVGASSGPAPAATQLYGVAGIGRFSRMRTVRPRRL